jgi:hypothetical protein
MRRRGRSRFLMSVRTAARNFDLLLAIANLSTSVPSFSRDRNDSDTVWRQQGVGLRFRILESSLQEEHGAQQRHGKRARRQNEGDE